MGASVIGGGGVDKSLCLPFGSIQSSTTPLTFSATTSYTTLYSGTGSGYLDLALFFCSGANATNMRVTFDGVVIFEGQAAGSTSYFGGLLNRNLIDSMWNGTSFFNFWIKNLYPQGVQLNISPLAVPHPYTANASGGNAPIAVSMDSFYFKSSILIELKAAVAGTIQYYLAGGKTP